MKRQQTVRFVFTVVFMLATSLADAHLKGSTRTSSLELTNEDYTFERELKLLENKDEVIQKIVSTITSFDIEDIGDGVTFMNFNFVPVVNTVCNAGPDMFDRIAAIAPDAVDRRLCPVNRRDGDFLCTATQANIRSLVTCGAIMGAGQMLAGALGLDTEGNCRIACNAMFDVFCASCYGILPGA